MDNEKDIQQGYIIKNGVKAPVTTTTQTIDTVIVDSDGNETTFKIDFPKSTVTREQVNTAFGYGIATGHWVSRYGRPYTTIKSVRKVTTTKYVEPLD